MKKTNGKDRIDALVDNRDKYYFRMGGALNILGESTYIKGDDFTENVSSLFESAEYKEAYDRFYELIEEAEKKTPGMSNALESAVMDWICADEDFKVLLGYVLGLRVAGMTSDQTKKMARTWRLGLPQNDPQ